MSKDKLGKIALADVVGLIKDLTDRLIGVDGRDWLKAFKRFLRKENPWPASILIDCDADPKFPCDIDPTLASGLKVDIHRKGGQVDLVPANIELYLDEAQMGEQTIVGTDLRKKLESMPYLNASILNANVLDALLEHTYLIPDFWKGKKIVFWGTIYGDPSRRKYVRYLYWDGDHWDCSDMWLDRGWRDDEKGEFDCNHPAARLRST